MGCSSSNNADSNEDRNQASAKYKESSSEKNGKGNPPNKPKNPNEVNFIIEQENLIKETKQSIKKNYQFLEKLGAGAFGTVYKVKHKLLGNIRAVKVLSKDALKQQEGDQTFLSEIAILSKLDHPNIIKIFDYYIDKNNFYVVNEIASGGELYDQIVNLQFFSESNAANIMKQLLSAVYYLHCKNFVHRDLKPENILLETNKIGDYTIKLIDFGAAISFSKQKLKEVTGTPYYIAPEVLKNSYNNKCDIWSCGVILYILLCGYPPFNASSEVEILELVEKGKYDFKKIEWDNVSNIGKEFVKKLMTYDPKQRITAEQALNDPWILKFCTNTVAKDLNKTRLAFENLKKFTAKQKLQQASIAFIVHQMSTNEHAKELRELFKALDKSSDGRLSLDELKEGYEKYFKDAACSEQEFQTMIDNLDSDKNGYIEYEEFLRATMKMDTVITDKNLELAFNFFDEDKSGKLEPDEIKKALGLTAESDKKEAEVLKKLIDEIDTNKDGVVSLDEFKELMKRVLQDRL